MTRRSKPVILLDIDGVAANFISAVVPIARQVLARPDITEETFVEFGLQESLKCSDEDYEAITRHISSRGFCASLAPYPGAVYGVQQLQAWADVYACTAPWDSDHWAREREQWCAKILGIPRRKIMSGDSKQLLDGNALVEDRAEMLEEWQQLGRPNLAVLFERPWNRGADWSGHSVSNWEQLCGLLKRRLA